MPERISFDDRTRVEVQRNPGMLNETTAWKNIYDIEQWRGGRLIKQFQEHNLITLEGKRYILDIVSKGATDIYTLSTNWYVCLTSTNQVAAVTMNYDGIGQGAPHFTEFVNFKSPTTARQAWVPVLDATLASITSNASKASFTIGPTPATQVFGAGLVTNATLADHANAPSPYPNALLSYSLFTAAITVAEDDVIKVGITLSIA